VGLKRLFLLVFAASVALATEWVDDYQDFTLTNPENTRNIIGDFVVIGNTVEGVTKCTRILDKNDINRCPIATRNNRKYYDNEYMTRFFNADQSSKAYLKLPESASKIVWAALVWQGHINNYSYQKSNTYITDEQGHDGYYYGSFDVVKINGKRYVLFHRWRAKKGYYYEISNDLPDNSTSGIKKTDANRVQIRIGDSDIYAVEADKVFYKSDTRFFCNKKGKECDYDLGDYKKKKGVKYSGYKVLDDTLLQELNSRIEEAKSSGLPIEISELTSSWGLEARLGDYGAWALAVIYKKDPSAEDAVLRNVSIYTGFKSLPKSDTHDMTIRIPGLILPTKSEINSYLTVFTAEGEKSLTGDYVQLNGVKLSQPYSDPNNIFDSYVSDEIRRDPQLENNNGIDIDVFDASDAMEKLRAENPDAVAYTATINVHSYPDGIFIGLIGFSTQLFEPYMCYTHHFTTESGEEIPEQGVPYGSKIITNVTIRNQGQEPAKKVKVYKDFDPQTAPYVPNSTEVKNIGEHDYVAMTDDPGDDLVEYDAQNDTLKVHLGQGATPDEGGEFDPADEAYFRYKVSLYSNEEVTISSYRTKYTFTIGGIDYDIEGDLPPCEDNNDSIGIYKPATGTFNVVDDTFSCTYDPANYNDPQYKECNVLFTQIVNKPFNVKVIKLDDDMETFDDDYRGMIRVDLIETPKIKGNETDEELEKLCQEADTLISRPATFTNLSYPGSPIRFSGHESLVEDLVYDRAVKDATFRVSYLVDRNDNLIVSMSPCIEQNYECLWGMLTQLYFSPGYGGEICATSGDDAPFDPTLCPCAQECMYANFSIGDGNQPIEIDIHGNNACLDCLFGPDGPNKTVCARDNFAIRPKAFAVIGEGQYRRAGEDFSLDFYALDEGNLTLADNSGTLANDLVGVPDYNEPVTNLSIQAAFYMSDPDNLTPTELSLLQQMYSNVENGATAPDVAAAISRIARCPSGGTFSINSTSFTDGFTSPRMQYSETGIIKLTVKEKDGAEFAIVDATDPQRAGKNSRFIDPATIIRDPDDTSTENLLVFIPYMIQTVLDGNGTDTDEEWLYISNEVKNAQSTGTTPKMATWVKYKIEAKNQQGETVLNFHRTCYPDTGAPSINGVKLNTTFDLLLDLKLQSDSDTTLTFYTENNQSEPLSLITQYASLAKNTPMGIQQWIGPDEFYNGIGEAKVFFNIDKDPTKPVPPRVIKVLEINTSTTWMNQPGATKKFVGQMLNEKFTFYYGRLHIPTKRISGNEGNITVYYEVYLPEDTNGPKDPVNIRGAISIDDVDWYVNTHHNDENDGNITMIPPVQLDPHITLLAKNPVANGEQDLRLRYDGNVFPYARTIGLNVSEWLLYDMYDPNIDRAFGRVIFVRSGGWLGKSKKRDFDADTETAPSTNENKRILW